jgi:hypothetical protein
VHIAQPKLMDKQWYFICTYPLCSAKEQFVPVTTTAVRRSTTIKSKYTSGDSQGPLCYGSYDRRKKKWTGSKIIDDDGHMEYSWYSRQSG